MTAVQWRSATEPWPTSFEMASPLLRSTWLSAAITVKIVCNESKKKKKRFTYRASQAEVEKKRDETSRSKRNNIDDFDWSSLFLFLFWFFPSPFHSSGFRPEIAYLGCICIATWNGVRNELNFLWIYIGQPVCVFFFFLLHVRQSVRKNSSILIRLWESCVCVCVSSTTKKNPNTIRLEWKCRWKTIERRNDKREKSHKRETSKSQLFLLTQRRRHKEDETVGFDRAKKK